MNLQIQKSLLIKFTGFGKNRKATLAESPLERCQQIARLGIATLKWPASALEFQGWTKILQNRAEDWHQQINQRQ